MIPPGNTHTLPVPARIYTADAPASHGYLEWNVPAVNTGAAAGVIAVGGTIYGMRVDCQAGKPVTKIVVACGTAASALTANQCIAVVIDDQGVEVARNADISGLFGATGIVPITVPSFTPVAGRAYSVLLLFVGTTPPCLVCAAGAGVTAPNAGMAAASPRRYFTAGTSQTAIAAPVTLSGTSATGALPYWVALAA